MPCRKRNKHSPEVRKHPELSRKVILGRDRENRVRNKIVGQVKRNDQYLKYGKPLPSVTTFFFFKSKTQGYEKGKELNHKG